MSTTTTSLYERAEASALYLPPCPSCRSAANVIRSGYRSNKNNSVQLYLCKNCNKRYTSRSIPHTKYSAKLIVSALTFYNLGHTLAGTAKEMRRRYKMDIPVSTLSGWVNRYAADFPFAKLRKRYEIDPAQIIHTRRFLHRQIYDFRYHALKLNIHAKYFPGLKTYLLTMEKGEDELLSDENSIFQNSHRCSDVPGSVKEKLPVPDIRHHSFHASSKMTALALTLARTGRDRHPKVEEFFLANDSATVTTEIPVYLMPPELSELGLPDELPLTGHIDLLQVRFDKLYVLDYKPDAAAEKNAAGQLVLYAFCLSRRTGIPLSALRCAYFDENDYYEFKL